METDEKLDVKCTFSWKHYLERNNFLIKSSEFASPSPDIVFDLGSAIILTLAAIGIIKNICR